MWDEQIVDVAREMTEGDAPANLRARVLDRIEARSEPRLGWKWIGLASAVGAGVAVLLIVLLLNTLESGRTVETRASAPPQTPTMVTPPAAAAADLRRAAPALTPAITTTRLAQRMQPVAQTQGIREPLEDALLPLLDSIDLEPLELIRLPPADSIAAEPLVIAVLELSPIDQQAIDVQ